MAKVAPEVSRYMSKLGRRGGMAGTGDKKRRPKKVCREGGRKGATRRWGERRKGVAETE